MAGGASDKKKLRKAWAHVAEQSGQTASAFALVDRGRIVAANAALTELLGADPVGLTWDELFESPLPSAEGMASVIMSGGRKFDVWSASAEGGTALALREQLETVQEKRVAPGAAPVGPDWAHLALDLARCESASEVDAVCRARAQGLVGPRGFVAVPSSVNGEVVVRCLWPVGQAAATILAFDHRTCDAIRTGEISTACRHSQGLVCTPVFVQGRLACVVGTTSGGESAELFAKLVGAALARTM